MVAPGEDAHRRGGRRLEESERYRNGRGYAERLKAAILRVRSTGGGTFTGHHPLLEKPETPSSWPKTHFVLGRSQGPYFQEDDGLCEITILLAHG